MARSKEARVRTLRPTEALAHLEGSPNGGYGLTDATLLEMKAIALDEFKEPLTRRASVRCPPKVSEIKAWRAVLAARVGIHISGGKTMDRKALHDSAYQLYSEEFIAKEARGERSNGLSEEALTAELSAESLQRLMRANDCNPVVETAGGELVGSVKGSTIWSMFESGNMLFRRQNDHSLRRHRALLSKIGRAHV